MLRGFEGFFPLLLFFLFVTLKTSGILETNGLLISQLGPERSHVLKRALTKLLQRSLLKSAWMSRKILSPIKKKKNGSLHDHSGLQEPFHYRQQGRDKLEKGLFTALLGCPACLGRTYGS